MRKGCAALGLLTMAAALLVGSASRHSYSPLAVRALAPMKLAMTDCVDTMSVIPSPEPPLLVSRAYEVWLPSATLPCDCRGIRTSE